MHVIKAIFSCPNISYAQYIFLLSHDHVLFKRNGSSSHLGSNNQTLLKFPQFPKQAKQFMAKTSWFSNFFRIFPEM